jgi:competence protein ComEA
VALAAVVAAVGVWRFWPAAPAPEIPFEGDGAEVAAPEISVATDAPTPDLVVHVAGAVERPGVYDLPVGARVADALDAAGGPTQDAAPDAINLARLLADGEQIYLPTSDEVAAGTVAGPAAATGTGGASASPAGGAVVNINSATAAELETLPGVGPSTAQKIVDDREKNGPFSVPDDLMRVPGIGPKKFEAMRDLVSCG